MAFVTGRMEETISEMNNAPLTVKPVMQRSLFHLAQGIKYLGSSLQS